MSPACKPSFRDRYTLHFFAAAPPPPGRGGGGALSRRAEAALGPRRGRVRACRRSHKKGGPRGGTTVAESVPTVAGFVRARCLLKSHPQAAGSFLAVPRTRCAGFRLSCVEAARACADPNDRCCGGNKHLVTLRVRSGREGGHGTGGARAAADRPQAPPDAAQAPEAGTGRTIAPGPAQSQRCGGRE